MKVIACIEDPVVIKQRLDHLKNQDESSETVLRAKSRAVPESLSFAKTSEQQVERCLHHAPGCGSFQLAIREANPRTEADGAGVWADTEEASLS